jgi:two-component system NtrC family sensor kinase
VIEDAVRLVLRSTSTAESLVRLELEPGLRIHARANELQQVFVNLVKNAVEALAEHGGTRVTVRARRDGAHVVAEVEDDGPGIPEAHLKSIFDPFFTTKPPGKGTGLGLNIVYRIISRHHGTIQVESSVGVGTRFSIRLPEDAQPSHGTSEPAGP